jgi:acetate---CoA ligase (ADP-forming) subunit beta
METDKDLRLLDYNKTKKLLQEFKISLPKEKLVQTLEEAEKFANSVSYPVVLKISSKDIVHKSDIGAVKANILKPEELKHAFRDIVYNSRHYYPDAKIDGMLIQKQEKGYEVIIGMKNDAVFGPVIMFGLGGIFVEVMKDVSFGVAPLTEKEAKEMIEKIKGYKILRGMRGSSPANIKSLISIIVNLSKLSLKNKFIQEIDFNPVFVNEKGSIVVDARVMYYD